MIGLFFGTFNPIHMGHLIIANYMVNYTALKEVWFVISPHNPFKERKDLADKYDRLEMVQLAIENETNLKASDIEFSLPLPSYTATTLAYIQEKYPNKEFALIMGADNIVSIKRWKNYESILNNHKIFVYPRPGIALKEWENNPNIVITESPQMDISSSFIRKAIKNNKSISYWTRDEVINFIEKKNLYK